MVSRGRGGGKLKRNEAPIGWYSWAETKRGDKLDSGSAWRALNPD